MKRISALLLFGMFSILLITMGACESHTKEIATLYPEDPEIENHNYSPTTFPQDTTQLWIGEGAMDRDTVFIAADGGPKNQLDYDFNGKTQWTYVPGFKNYIFVNVHQSSTYNPEIFNWTKEFTLEDGIREVDNSSEMLYRAIKYFKDRNKYVIVVGHSYGAFVIPHYLATRPSLADTYLVTGGRLIADSLQTFYQLKGFNSGFEEDGKTLRVPDTLAERNPYRSERYYQIRQAKEMLKGGLSIRNFVEELDTVDLRNFHFFYGLKDQNVGVPYPAEIEFLKAKGAKVFGVDSNHYNIYREVINMLEDGTISF
ncbi:MAG: hypothetical protein AAFP76_08545 [Bacteroidota bacterium]